MKTTKKRSNGFGRNLLLAGMAAMLCALGLAVAGCSDGNNNNNGGDEFNLDKLLRKYMGPDPQFWGHETMLTYTYRLDPSRFEAFRAELDAGGEYIQFDARTESDRDWNVGLTFIRWSLRPYVSGNFGSYGCYDLELFRADNSVSTYVYKKNPTTPGLNPDELLPGPDELLRKYMVPLREIWGDGADAEDVDIYFLDHSRFNAFKAELDAGGKYQQIDEWNETRDWNTGTAFARWAVRDDSYELDICNADNSRYCYRYNTR